jgi:hypothetical protein
MNSDKSIAYILEHDIRDTARLLDEGHDPYAICAAKLRNVLMIYKTTLSSNEYKSMMEYVMTNLDDVPDLKDYAGLTNKVKGMH